MCEICTAMNGTPQERTAMRDGLLMNAESLEKVAAIYRQLAHQEFAPHTQRMKDQMPLIHNAIRLLVEDFL